MITLVSQDLFRAAFNGARAGSSRVAESTSQFSHVDGTRYYYVVENIGGFAIRPDGELVYVFSTVKGQGDVIVRAAIARGADHLDCFDGYLVSLYRRHGFERITSLDNWTPGGPDVVYMARPGAWLKAHDKAGGSL